MPSAELAVTAFLAASGVKKFTAYPVPKLVSGDQYPYPGGRSKPSRVVTHASGTGSFEKRPATKRADNRTCRWISDYDRLLKKFSEK
jgi:hypothetical protein